MQPHWMILAFAMMKMRGYWLSTNMILHTVMIGLPKTCWGCSWNETLQEEAAGPRPWGNPQCGPRLGPQPSESVCSLLKATTLRGNYVRSSNGLRSSVHHKD